MFDLNAFIMKTLKGMIGNYPDFQVREYALNWYAKGTLTEDDLATVEAMIEAQYVETETEIEVTETEMTENETEDETYEYTEDYTETEYVEETEE